VGSFGLLTCGVFRLAGLNEAQHFTMVTLVSLVMAAMFIVLILQNKNRMALVLSGDMSESSLQYRLTRYWHHMAISIVVLITIVSIIQRLFFGVGSMAA